MPRTVFTTTEYEGTNVPSMHVIHL